jgi:hypothetical protein
MEDTLYLVVANESIDEILEAFDSRYQAQHSCDKLNHWFPDDNHRVIEVNYFT